MANRNKGQRRGAKGRSRKRRTSSAGASQASSTAAATAVKADAAGASTKRPSRARARSSTATKQPLRAKDLQTYGERPEPPWHPLPLSELLILIGAIATVIGATKLNKGISSGSPTLIVGILAVAIGTVEFSLREHRSGYRSHTILLSALPTAAFYTGALVLLSAFVSPLPFAAKLAPLALALPLFAILFKVLRVSFQDARRERVFTGGRRR